ncbi:MAG: trimethylamine methyltransferase family protein [Deltaproteobacteria bacterium]|nr:trimethylamine methyltransferase family protein [Deltaproteobacteria bacterium]MBW2120948.1 trimethylamine methyltransferase family protein [Deltaproteobacteria bacterium]
MDTWRERARSGITPIVVRPGMRIELLSGRELERVHQATLTVLGQSGVRFPYERGLKIFAEAGAKVDFESKIVRIPADLLMRSLANAPRTIAMASRGPEDLDLYLDGTRSYCGTEGTGLAVVDLETRKRRPSTKRDVAMMAQICDYLPSIGFYWPMVSARDVPPGVISLHELEASFTHTEKHVHIISCTEAKTAGYAVEMARAVAGDSESLRKRPPLSLLVCATSPLTQDKGSLEAALRFAEAGLPVCFCTMPVVGSTGPGSMAGTMIMGNAEILSALCLIQLVYPGAPVCYAFFHDMINPFTGQCWASAPQKAGFHTAVVQLGHYYNLPVMSGYGGTDARKPESWQTGKDNAIDALFSFLTGPDLMPSLGLLEAYTLLYPEKILLDTEIFNSVKTMTEGVRIDEGALALDEIMAVGPGGHFLDRDYTCENLRKLWQPGVANQWSPQAGGFLDPQEAAIEKIRWILANHHPNPLEEKVEKELARIIRTAERELLG